MFKPGDRVRRKCAHGPYGAKYPKDSEFVIAYMSTRTTAFSNDDVAHSTSNLELVVLDLEERLSQAKSLADAATAEVARIEAEIAEAAKPKVGDRYVTSEFDGSERYWILFGFHNGTAIMGREGTNVVCTLDAIVTYGQGRKVDK